MTGLPRSIQIQTTTKCTRKCSWCPNYKLEDGEMSFDVLDRVLGSLKQAGYQGHFHPYLMAEPLCDERLCVIIHRIREMFPENSIFIYTNGDLLTREMCRELGRAGLNAMKVSVYGNPNPLLFELAEEAPRGFINLCRGMEAPYNRGGNVEVECSKPREFCEWLWTKAYINWKGEVILCCSDYEFEVVLGNLLEKPFKNIWNSRRYWAYRDAHREGRGHTMPLCNKCNRIRRQGDGRRRLYRSGGQVRRVPKVVTYG